MICNKCGATINKKSKFCAYCGAKVVEDNSDADFENVINDIENETNQTIVNTNTDTQANNQPKAKFSGMAIAGFVLSLVPCIGNDTFITIVCSILGIVFSAIGRKVVASKGYRGKGLAIAGLVISIVGLSLAVFYLLISLIAHAYI